jgi:hypothetical protein
MALDGVRQDDILNNRLSTILPHPRGTLTQPERGLSVAKPITDFLTVGLSLTGQIVLDATSPALGGESAQRCSRGVSGLAGAASDPSSDQP